MNSRADDLILLLRGQTTVSELALKHRVSEGEVEAWKEGFLSGLAARSPGVSIPRWVVQAGVTLALVGAGLAATKAWAGTCASMLPSPLVTMCPDEPALASEINGNFNQLVTWLQNKVGPVGSSSITAGSITASSLTVTGGASTGGNLTVGGNLSVRGSALGAYAGGYAVNTDYTAISDGFVLAWFTQANDGARCWFHGNVDGTPRQKGSLHFFTGSDVYVGDDSIMFPVKKGSVWRVNLTNTSGSCNSGISWVALNP